MIYLERVGDEIILTSDTVLTAGYAKQVPGARHDARRQLWRYPLSWATCVVAREVFGQKMEVGPELVAWATAEFNERVQPAMQVKEESS